MIGAHGNAHRDQHHDHLWQLVDGTPIHAPPGSLSVDGDGRVACHLCGRWFHHLGGHLRAHGYSASDYRDAVGLTRHRALCSATLSSRVSERQAAAYRHDDTLRRRLEHGHELARSGELTRAALASAAGRRDGRRTPAQETTLRRAALAQGRETQARLRAEKQRGMLQSRSCPDLGTLLRAEYAAGASLAGLAHVTGLGRSALRRELVAARVVVRPTGRNRQASLAAKAHRIDVAVATRIGINPTELRDWLLHQRETGQTLAALADATGRSLPWIRARLAGRTTTVTAQRRLAVVRASSGSPSHPTSGSAPAACSALSRCCTLSGSRC